MLLRIAGLLALLGGVALAFIWYQDQMAAPEFRAPDTPYAPTPELVVARMLEVAALEPDDTLYDLGSGDGRILITAAVEYGVHARGFELDPALVDLSTSLAKEAGVAEKVSIERADILTVDLTGADVITLSLNEELNRKLAPSLEALKPSARIISHGHPIGEYMADKLIRFAPEVAGAQEHLIYVYTLPLRTRDELPVRTAGPRQPDINFVPTPEPVVDDMLGLAGIEPGEVVYDLGSGDGRILLKAAQIYGATAVGYEIDPQLVALSHERITEAGLDERIEVREGNLFEADLREANVVTLYLSPTMNRKLIPQFEAMKPGARIVSHDFDIPGIKQQTILRVTPGGRYKRERTIYLWVTPLERIEP